MTCEDRHLLEKYSGEADPVSSVQNFTALYMWRKPYGLEICEDDSVLYMKRTSENVRGYLPPLVLKDEDLEKALKKMEIYSEENSYPFVILEAEKWFIEKLTALRQKKDGNISWDVRIYSDHNNSEYLYSGEKLKTLSGKKMHQKKNHYNRFVKTHQYEIKDIFDCPEDILKMFNKWLKGRESEDTLGELEGVRELLGKPMCFDIKGIAVFVDGKCGAFTISENTGDNSVLVHSEKADDEIPGLFTFVNSENIKINHPDAEIVNREQDLGIPGLRKAKESWKPIGFVSKFTVVFSK